MRGQVIKPFDTVKEFVLSVNGILPVLDGRNLVNLPNNNQEFGNANLNYLLFRVPHIVNEEKYHLSIEFSTTDTFDTFVSFDSIDDTLLFKGFTGIGMTPIQNTGLNYIFSDEVLQFDISSIGSEYKYFRFRWTNDNGLSFGRYGYGNREAGMQIFDIDNTEELSTIFAAKIHNHSISDIENLQAILNNKLTIPVGGNIGQVLKKTESGYVWADDLVGESITIDSSLSTTSTNPIQNNVVTAALNNKITAPSNGTNGQVLSKTSNGYAWVDQTPSITIDSVLSNSSVNPVQNKIITEALSTKITMPSNGSVGQVLKKTSNGVEWSDDLTGESITIDSTLSLSSTNPVQNKVIKAALDEKLTIPSGGTNGQVLSKTSTGYTWITPSVQITVDSSLSTTSENPVQNKVVKSELDKKSELNYLLFKIPQIENEEFYHFYIEFSETDNFDNVISYNTSSNNSMFKVFTGLEMEQIASTGIRYLFSEDQLQLDISNISKNLKYFRFRWSNDDGLSFGRYGYGNREANTQVFDVDTSVAISDVIGLEAVLSNKANTSDVVALSLVKTTPTANNKIITENDTINNAITAEKLSTSRSITLSGSITGTANYDSNGNININTSLGSGFTIDASNIEGLTINWNDIQSKPSFANIATSGLASDVVFNDNSNYFGGGNKNVSVVLNNIGSSLSNFITSTSLNTTLNNYVTITSLNTTLSGKADVSNVYTKSQVDNLLIDLNNDSHTHSNIATLNKFSESNGSVVFNGTTLSTLTLNDVNNRISTSLNGYVTSSSLSTTLSNYYTKNDIDNMDLSGNVWAGGGLNGDGTEDNPLEVNLYNFFPYNDMSFGYNGENQINIQNGIMRLYKGGRLVFNGDSSGVTVGEYSQKLTLQASSLNNLKLHIGSTTASANEAYGLAVVGSDGKLPSSILPETTTSSSSLNYLLFRIPNIGEEETYHLFVEFSTTDTFSNVITYSSLNNNSLFKVFTGMQMASVQTTGISYVYSEEQLQFDISSISSEYKYFRFHWSNDEGLSFGRYGYGNIEAGMQIFDTHDDNTLRNQVINLTSSNGDNILWGGDGNGDFVMITHNMNCIPIVTIYDDKKVLYTPSKLKINNENSITIWINAVVNNNWKVILTYGCEY